MTVSKRPLILKLAAAPVLLVAGAFALRAFVAGVVNLMFAASDHCSAYGACLPGGWMTLGVAASGLVVIVTCAGLLLTPRKSRRTGCPA